MAIDITHHALISCTPEEAFAIVADVPTYPDFLPWCLDAHILSQEGNQIVADLTIGYKAFCHTYRSHVTCTPFSTIEVRAQEGPLDSLSTQWRFEPQGDHQTLITLHLTLQLRSFLLERALSRVIESGTHRIAQAFQARAQAATQKQKPETAPC